MSEEITIQEAVRKMEKYLLQLIPYESCPEKEAKNVWKREQVRLQMVGISSVGPTILK